MTVALFKRRLSSIARSILRQYNGTLFAPVLGVNVYSDSAGSTLAVKDGVVGRVNCLIDSGLYASQATAGYKPYLRVGAKNLLTYSEDFSSTAWVVKTGATKASTNNASPTGSLNALLLSGATDMSWSVNTLINSRSTLGPSLLYTASVYIKSAGAATVAKIGLRDGSTGTLHATSSTLISATTWTRLTLTATTGAATTQFALGVGGADGDILVWGAMIETGSTASQYVATTTEPASNGIGPTWLDPDGVDDRLQLSAVPFQMADDHFVVAGCTPLTVGKTAFSEADAASTSAMIRLMTDGSGLADAYFRDNANLSPEATVAGSLLGLNSVIGLRKVGNAKYARKNGTQSAAENTVLGASTITAAGIGYRPASTALDFWSGPIYAIALGTGAITDAQLKLVERYAEQLSEVQL